MASTICLCMIVKNEAHVLKRCLSSVMPMIQSWLIVDTGSTDGTQALARDVLSGLPGELVERPWKNFGHNRTEALELARQKADYALVIDADDVLENTAPITEDLTADAYTLTVLDQAMSYRRRHLFKSTCAWRYEGVVHEIAECKAAGPTAHYDKLTYRRLGGGARSQARDKYLRDARILEEALRSEPTHARYTFYLAQSYGDAGDVDRAIDRYRARTKLGGWEEEVFVSFLQIARLSERRGDAPDVVTAAYLDAYNARPERAESLCDLARYQRRQKNHALAYLFAQAAVATARPDDALFVDEDVYTWRRLDELALAAIQVGDHATARQANATLLAITDLPANIRERTEKTRDFLANL